MMRFFTFITAFVLFTAANSRPIARAGFFAGRAAIGEETLDTTSAADPLVTSDGIQNSTIATPGLITDSAFLATATASLSADDVITLASASVVPTDSVSAIDPSVTDPTDVGSSVDISATPTDSAAATATDVAAIATPTSTSSISFDVPTSPPACVAKLNNPSLVPSSTFSASTPDPSVASDNSTLSDSGLNATSTLSATDSVSSSATASDSISASSVPATASASDSSALPIATPFVSLNPNVTKRIAQDDLPAVAQAWQDLCLVSGGDIFTDEPCVTLAGIDGINALLASADPCDQQDNADAMIDFAKSPGVTNSDELIANAIAYRQHPRNALNINGVVPSTPFCQRAPRNPELVGIVNDQLSGVDPGIFGGPSVGLVAFGDASSCPLGSSPDVDTCSCVSDS